MPKLALSQQRFDARPWRSLQRLSRRRAFACLTERLAGDTCKWWTKRQRPQHLQVPDARVKQMRERGPGAAAQALWLHLWQPARCRHPLLVTRAALLLLPAWTLLRASRLGCQCWALPATRWRAQRLRP